MQHREMACVIRLAINYLMSFIRLMIREVLVDTFLILGAFYRIEIEISTFWGIYQYEYLRKLNHFEKDLQ